MEVKTARTEEKRKDSEEEENERIRSMKKLKRKKNSKKKIMTVAFLNLSEPPQTALNKARISDSPKHYSEAKQQWKLPERVL